MTPLYVFLVLLTGICWVPAVGTVTAVTQDSGVITAEVGGTVTLKCFCDSYAVTFQSWYQQSLGRNPLLISTRMRQHQEATIHLPYKERFQVKANSQEGSNHLIISQLRLSDTATYYCGILEFNSVEFGRGAFLHVKMSLSNFQAVVHQPALELLQPGDSVNLTCTVYPEKCDGEQSVYWFRHGAAQPVIMYQSLEQCADDLESHMKNCTLNLTIMSANTYDTGMYYCALASCGEIVFGNGTRVEITGGPTKVSSLLVYFLSVALAASILLLLVLAFVMYKLKKEICTVCKGNASHPTCSAASDLVSQDADALHYAALNLNRASERHCQEEMIDSACVYSRVKNRKE